MYWCNTPRISDGVGDSRFLRNSASLSGCHTVFCSAGWKIRRWANFRMIAVLNWGHWTYSSFLLDRSILDYWKKYWFSWTVYGVPPYTTLIVLIVHVTPPSPVGFADVRARRYKLTSWSPWIDPRLLFSFFSFTQTRVSVNCYTSSPHPSIFTKTISSTHHTHQLTWTPHKSKSPQWKT